MSKKVLVAMSGGVDSSAAALVLKKQGYDVAGAIMRLSEPKIDGYVNKNIEDARNVCQNLGIDFYVFDYREEFEKIVIGDFIENYKNALTPNPCIMCNKNFKFGKFLEKARELGYDYIATGHYAKVVQNEDTGRYMLVKSEADKKDQTYVLYNMSQDILAHTIFPLGTFSAKEEIRELARESGLDVASKADSQEICFIPDNDYATFIENHIGKFPAGNIVNKDGKVLGKHDGIIHYTVGQRKGLGISSANPLFVIKIDKDKNEVVVGEEKDIFSNELYADKINFISFEKLENEMECEAKIRYSSKPASCKVMQVGDDRVRVVFDEPQRAITPGQAVVFYKGNEIIGGGRIR